MKAIYSIILKAKTILQGNFQLIFEIEIYFTNSYTFFFKFAKYVEYLSGRTTTTIHIFQLTFSEALDVPIKYIVEKLEIGSIRSDGSASEKNYISSMTLV